MIRLSEIKLPLAAVPADAAEHPLDALRAQAVQILGIAPTDIAGVHVHKRSFDARKADLLAVYIIDLALADPSGEAVLLARHAGRPHIQPTPDIANETEKAYARGILAIEGRMICLIDLGVLFPHIESEAA